MPLKLTQKRIEALTHGGKAHSVRDTEVKGLLIDVNKLTKSYKVQADLWTGERGKRAFARTLRITIGRTDEVSLDEARARAAVLLAEIKSGRDPRAPKAPSVAPELTVAAAFAAYAAHIRASERSERTAAEYVGRFLDYLEPWKTLPLPSITKAQARERHEHLARTVGAVSSNKALRALRAVWNHAVKTTDIELGVNPVLGVTFRKERAKNRSIEADALAEWHGKVRALPSPMRREMHTIGLFTGLRPGNLVSLRKEWVRVADCAIVIPASNMKARKEFSLPLSDHVVSLVKQALVISEMNEPGSPWLFPTRDMKGAVRHTAVWKERTLPSETGHILRHTFSNMAAIAGVAGDDRQLLLGQTLPGVRGVYINTPSLWTRLLSEQSRVSEFILSKIGEASK